MELIYKLQDFLASRQEIVAAYLFGSQAEGVARRNSDIDIAVLVDEQARGTFEYRLMLADEVERLAGTQVDLVLLRESPLLLQFQILKKGKIIFERDADRRASYEMYVLGKYYDYQRFFDFHSKSLKEAIKERGLGLGHTSN